MNTNLPNYMTRTMLAGELANPTVKSQIADQQLNSSTTLDKDFPFSTLNSIDAIPYQFMASVDRRVARNGESFGRKYSQKILSQLPILFMMPCRPKFMPGYDENSKSGILGDLMQESSDFIGNFLKTKIGGMYYSVEFAYDEYYTYLNQMISNIAGYMGLGDESVNLTGKGEAKRVPLRNMNWANLTTKETTNNIFSAAESIAFFVDGLNSIDTSFSNDTRPSSLAGTVNNYSDMANEVSFLVGEDSFAAKATEFGAGVGEGIGDIASSLLGGITGGLLDSLMDKGTETILHGGKIIFPEIWSDSEHSESYSFTVKLRSPDNDSLSILLNVIVPYCKILAMTMAKTIDGNPNGYKSPFLVKAYCKGLFSIDMGIIDSLQVTKGAECMWNDDGLPTQIDMNFSIKNLYNNLAMTGSDQGVKELIANTAYMDFLANMAGCNVMQENYKLEGQVVNGLYNVTNRLSLTNNVNKVYNTISNKISNTIGRVYGYTK